jgi:hypothetical protein
VAQAKLLLQQQLDEQKRKAWLRMWPVCTDLAQEEDDKTVQLNALIMKNQARFRLVAVPLLTLATPYRTSLTPSC